MFETIPIEVVFHTTKSGEYSSLITIDTTSGTTTANVNVTVNQMADFSSVVTTGLKYVTSFETSDTDPFDVKDGVAFNINTGFADDIPTTSWFKINFTIPEGHTGDITWEGEVYSDVDPLNPWDSDYAYIDIDTPGGRWTMFAVDFGNDASSLIFSETEGFADALICQEGDYSVTFNYYKNGDSKTSESDILKIYDFSIYVDGDNVGIDKLNLPLKIVSTSIYDLNGVKIDHPRKKGVNIIRTTCSDGTVKSSKVIVK